MVRDLGTAEEVDAYVAETVLLQFWLSAASSSRDICRGVLMRRLEVILRRLSEIDDSS